ncbi:MAG: M20/M25/M40 family metallo-hydrolase [Tissierellia bacterium]|nr:M20/M25/M40 family metallo-hydrolase [Tissierellia bacterium]
MEFKERLQDLMDQYFNDIKKLADDITSHPELGGDEKYAMERYEEFFTGRGFTFEENYKEVPYAFLVRNKESKGKKQAVLMSEFDALPEIGHACGHSISGSISALAFLVLQDLADELDFEVVLMGTPAEEIPGGKVALARNGAFDEYLFAAMVHLNNYTAAGTKALACTDRRFTFHGKSSHASGNPQEGINAVNGVRLSMDALDMWRPHFPNGAQIHGMITQGGVLPSIIPELGEFSYYFRAVTLKEMNWLCDLAEDVVKGVAKATRTTVEIHQDYETYADLSNTPIKIDTVTKILEELGETVHPWDKNPASTDAGNVDQIIPTFHPLLRVPGAEKAELHSRDFAELMTSKGAYEALKMGALLLATLFYKLGTQNKLLLSIIEEHKKYRRETGELSE